MKLARYEAHGEVAYGVVEGDAVFQLTASPFEDYQVTDHAHPLSHVRLLAPTAPSKIIAIGLNYKSHLGDREPPAVPEVFFKTPSAVIGPGDTIVLPRESQTVQEEAELVVIIGKRCKRATAADALSYVLGYTCGNDVSERVWQRNDLQWWRAKASDTFAPLGPYIDTDIDPASADIEVRINGEMQQKGNTSDLIFDVPTIISFISEAITLEPGDVIYTGTPGIPGSTRAGDVVEVEIRGIGVLRNYVADEA